MALLFSKIKIKSILLLLLLLLKTKFIIQRTSRDTNTSRKSLSSRTRTTETKVTKTIFVIPGENEIGEGEKKKKHFHPLLHHHHQRRGISTTLAASRAPNNNSKLWPTNSCVGTCSTESLLLQRHVFLMKVQLFLPLFPLERENKSLTSPEFSLDNNPLLLMGYYA